MHVYKVGGAVRDKLLGLETQDVDWVLVGANPADLIKQGYQQVGRDFPVFLHPKTKEEYALARTERKTQGGYTGFSVYAAPDVTLEEDLCRRDLTINAMAEDAAGKLIDPFNGQADLKAGILRHVSPAFVEDPVRILRLARFAARFNFSIAPETLELMRQMLAAGEVDYLVPERVWQETVRALGEKYPARFIEVLHECGALAKVFPEIAALFGVPQPEKHHPEIDTGIHTLLVVQQARLLSDDPQVIFAALTHDLGKGATPSDILPHHYGHEETGGKLVAKLCRRCRVPSHFQELAVLVARFHTHCHRVTELKPQTVLQTLQHLDAFRRPQRFAQFLLACEADARGRLGLENRPYPQAALFQSYFEQVQQVDVADVVAAGFTGAKIGEELQRRRVFKLKTYLSDCADKSGAYSG